MTTLWYVLRSIIFGERKMSVWSTYRYEEGHSSLLNEQITIFLS